MGKKPAKVRTSTGVVHEDTSTRMFGMSSGHVIGDRVHMTARCGTLLSGWFYGTMNDVKCSPCKEALA